MKTGIIALALTLFTINIYAQGYNHQWLLGSANSILGLKGRAYIDNSFSFITEYRKMPFYGTQGNICDSSGNLLMASNGVWIANASGDTMMNGSGINPGGITPNWPNGLPMEQNNVFVPYPNDNSKFILLHHTAYPYYANSTPAFELFYSVVDISLNGGLGEVTSKNNVILYDTLMWGISVCQHANGRDWWAFMMKDSSSIIQKILISDTGVSFSGSQNLGYFPVPVAAAAQLTFSPDGTKFISTTYDNPVDRNSSIVLSRFDRCTGMFSNTLALQLTSGAYLWGLAFSPSGKYAYASSSNYIFQIDADTYTLVDTVATFDGFISPGPNCCYTSFWNMYLAANGKIYITSGSGVQHLTVINHPDSAGMACDVQQHSIPLGFYHLRSVPNHPNYYLGCDTTLGCPCLTTGIDEVQGHDFKFSVSPNPASGSLKIIYMLPQNQSGKLEVFDLNGRRVYEMRLPPWSTLQQMDVSFLSGGVYSCVVSSGGYREVRKLVVVWE
jgi:DNA-binding beta-propeller fold protein YncE